MSRLDYMTEQELSVLTIAEEVDALEQLVRSGKTMDASHVRTLTECVERLSRLLTASAHEQDDVPLPDWLQPMPKTTGPGSSLPDPNQFKARSG